jgi:hypothetical protein
MWTQRQLRAEYRGSYRVPNDENRSVLQDPHAISPTRPRRVSNPVTTYSEPCTTMTCVCCRMVDPTKVPAANKSFIPPWAPSDEVAWSSEYLDEYVGFGTARQHNSALLRSLLFTYFSGACNLSLRYGSPRSNRTRLQSKSNPGASGPPTSTAAPTPPRRPPALSADLISPLLCAASRLLSVLRLVSWEPPAAADP